MHKTKFEYKFLVLYLIIGGFWILFSDRLLESLISDVKIISQLQTYKGWFYVLVTGVFFYSVLKKHLIKVRKAEEEARESDRLKSAFLQNMSHEIRTPMNGIIGFCDLLQEEDLSEEQRHKYLDIVTKSSNQLLNVVNDILDVSLIETGNIQANEDQIQLNEFLDHIYKSTKVSLTSNKISILLSKGQEKENVSIVTDAVKLEQIFTNLLGNAKKFTTEGYIEFGYEFRKDEILFFVKDTGIGISEEFIDSVFDRFNRAEIETTKTIGGTGLGLAICKGNVELLGGEIWVESVPNFGSRFYFTIPYVKGSVVKELEGKKSEYGKYENISIVIAEDEESNFIYMAEVLEELKLDIIWAKNGREAVDICKQNNNVKMVLMDIKMPELNGYEATQQIREFNKELPIVAQTAFALGDEKSKALKSGCNAYLSKPFKKSDLISLLESFLAVENVQ
jgi:signal transduction histidine kinase/ActR/RegA family two-component response regulator